MCPKGISELERFTRDVDLDEIAGDINERIADLKIKKIRIRERLKAIENKSEKLMSRCQKQLEAVEQVKLLANDIVSPNWGLRTFPVEASQVADVQAEEEADVLRADSSTEPKESPPEVESHIDTPPEINFFKFKLEPDTRVGQGTYVSDSLGSLKEQLDAENPGKSPPSDPDEKVSLRV